MRKVILGVSLGLLVVGGVARAEVTAMPIPADIIQNFVPLAVQLIQAQFKEPPVKVDVSTDHVVGYHVNQMVGLLVLPDKNFTAKTITDAGDKDVPVAVLATKSLSLQDRDTVVNGDRLAVAGLNGAIKIPVFFVAVKAQGADRVLDVYSKDGSKPILTVPVKKQTAETTQPIDMKFSNIDLEKKRLDVTLNLGGSYESTFKMGFLDQ